jgi:adenine-specific DNA-methyltransferase
MYPRLKLAKNLLRDDGVIFISIDDNEVSNLKKLCDEIFGEENFVRNLPTIMNLKGNNDEYAFAGTHEYTLVYCRNREKTKFNEFSLSNEEFDNWEEDEYGYYKKGANLKSTGGNAPRAKRPNLYFPIYIGKDNSVALKRVKDSDIEIFPITNDQEMSWRWSREKISNELYNIIVVRNGDDISIYKKQRPNIGELPTKKPKSIFYKPEYSSGNGTNELKSLFTNKIFDNPKPLTLIKDFIILGMDQDDIILDFFEGSGTTEHAVLDLNSEVGGKRKFICVQLPEPCQENSEAFKAGYKTIAEIGKERIRRAGEKILENNKDKDSIENLDVGFKVFKLDSSNIKSWDVDFDNLEQSLFDAVHNIKDERTEDDVLYEILLKYGLDLTLPIEERKIAGKTVYSIGIGALVICLDSEITIDVVEGIGKLKAELKPEVMRIVFKDSGFKDDVIKTNTIQILKQYNIEDVKSL